MLKNAQILDFIGIAALVPEIWVTSLILHANIRIVCIVATLNMSPRAKTRKTHPANIEKGLNFRFHGNCCIGP